MLNGTEISLTTGFNILLLIPSGPLALFGFKISISGDYISDAVHQSVRMVETYIEKSSSAYAGARGHMRPYKLHCYHMRSLRETDTPVFVLFMCSLLHIYGFYSVYLGYSVILGVFQPEGIAKARKEYSIREKNLYFAIILVINHNWQTHAWKNT